MVRERGIDPDASLLPVTFEDDEDFEFGIIVTRDRRIIQFGFRYSDPTKSDGVITEWNDISEGGFHSLHHESSCAVAFNILDECA